MTSGLDTLLEAARYLELQEQQSLALSPSPTSSIGGRYHHQHYNNNNTNINSNINNARGISRHHQMSSPPTSPLYTSNTGGSAGSNHVDANGNDFLELTSSVPVTVNRNREARSEEPYLNGHSIASPYVVISSSSTKVDYDTPSNAPSLFKSIIATEHSKDYMKNQSSYRLPSPNLSPYIPNDSTPRKFVPLTPPPVSSSKIQPTRIRSLSLSSNKITANGNGPITHNGNVHNVLPATAEDSSQSSLNLSSSGYLSGSSANSSVGGNGSSSNLNNSTASTSTQGLNTDHQIQTQQPQTSGRRRTTSTNSNGAGTREVHNKLEKHRRAHLKECFEQLKVQLQLKDEEKKKTSNLAILGAAYRHVMSLRRKERELEQQVEQLAKEKINAQKKILSLKRELSTKYDNIDFSNIISDGDFNNIPNERVSENLSDSLSLSSGRGSVRYSSSSSLSSATTVSSPLGSAIQTTTPKAMSPVISVTTNTSPGSPLLKSSSPLTNVLPLSLTTKSLSGSTLSRGSPTPSTPSPCPSSSGVSSSSPTTSSPPIGNTTSIALKIPNVPNGIKLSPTSPPSIALVSSATLSSSTPNIACSENCDFPSTMQTTMCTGLPLNLNTSQNVQIPSAPKDLSGKNGVCKKISEVPRESSPSRVVLANSTNLGCPKDIKVEKVFDENEQPTKVIKLFNGIALAPVDKDNKLISSTPLALSQVVGGGGLVVSPFPMLTTSSPGLRVIGTNGLATIELSSPTVQSQTRCQQQSQTSPTTVTSTSGAQLHKLLVSGTSTTSGASAVNHTSNVASELARLPGGAELNILPAGTNGTTTLYRGNGKLAIVNNSITLKESANASGRAVHVVTPIQSGGTPISGLTPIVVSQGQPGSNLAHIIAPSPQLAGKVNLSVGGQALPLISTQYLSSVKPMVVAVASNTTPTLSSVPSTPTSATVATGTANGSTS